VGYPTGISMNERDKSGKCAVSARKRGGGHVKGRNSEGEGKKKKIKNSESSGRKDREEPRKEKKG